uniref:Cytochrome b n=1 Tax=Aposthonia borneensis TaxID=1208762 RepID=A0A678PBX0_9NEOP|nr:cytochrome b [Aposthonia borneensis]
MMKFINNNSTVFLPSPSNISLWWNLGSLLGLCLMLQIITGFILSMHYTPNIEEAFQSTSFITRNMNKGWFLRTMHSNCTSAFFICIYLHIGRNLMFNSFNLINTWMSGMIILIMLFMTAFIGYVLPWSQMSFWGATVITNLVSAIPYIGHSFTSWIWGGFSINNATLNRFFSLHFILPFMIATMAFTHLIMLHNTGSNNPLGTSSNLDKSPFNQFFTSKDYTPIMMLIFILTQVSLINPYLFSDPDHFMIANPMITPTHIQPEWYFLFAYAILRSIPNKLGGVLTLSMSLMILVLIPTMTKMNFLFHSLSSIHLSSILTIFILLTWIGMNPVEYPFIKTGQILTSLYFILFLSKPLMHSISNKYSL